MRYRKYRKNGEQRFVKYLVRIIIALIILMLILVVHDRYVFHRQVYDIAISEINVQKKAYTDSIALDSLKKSGLFADTISRTVQISAPSSDTRNRNEISQTVNINNPEPIGQVTEDVTSIINKLKDTDGLISANGITYLISLIVALLIALVSDKVIEIGKQMSEMNDLKITIENSLKEQILQLDEKIEEKVQHALKTSYNHTTNYNSILNMIETLYNHTIIVYNTLSSAGIDENTLGSIGLLSSRINLIYDNIIARFNDNKHRLVFVTSDERYLLKTYIEDALLCLNETRNTVNNNNTLKEIIQDKIYLVEEIRDKIDAIEILENIYAS